MPAAPAGYSPSLPHGLGRLVLADDGSKSAFGALNRVRHTQGLRVSFAPRKVDVGLYEGPPASKRRIAFVFRCTRPRRWYGAAWPHRVVVPCAEEARA